MKNKKGYFAVLSFVFLLAALMMPLSTMASSRLDSYGYDNWNNTYQSPLAYEPMEIITGEKLGIGAFSNISDLFAGRDDLLYVADTQNNRILILDEEHKPIKILTQTCCEEQKQTLNKPEGIFVTSEGILYIADTQNDRIVAVDEKGNVVREVKDIDDPALPESFAFKPSKLSVDDTGRIYCVVNGVYDGLMVFGHDNTFERFIGANRVQYNLWDYFWKSVATVAQTSAIEQYIPTEYTNVLLDHRNFLYVTGRTVFSGQNISNNSIKKLNLAGDDILNGPGRQMIFGDSRYTTRINETGEVISDTSVFVDICHISDSDVYIALDSAKSRIFAYDQGGNLLFVTGGSDNVLGGYKNPSAIAVHGDGDIMYIADRGNNAVTVLRATEYVRTIYNAIIQYNQGNYDRSAEHWRQIVSMNVNLEQAYSGIGRAYMRQSNYKKAMEYYKKAWDRPNYDIAYRRYRENAVKSGFGYVFIGIMVVFAILILLKRLRRKKEKEWWEKEKEKDTFLVNLSKAFYLMIHPFKGFDELKYEKKKTLLPALFFGVAFYASFILYKQYTGFLFNKYNIATVNIFTDFLIIASIMTLWCVSNFGLSVLADGEGTMKDIVVYSGYSLCPMILGFLSYTLLSNFVTGEEYALCAVLLWAGIFWTALLLIFGTLKVHDLSLSKTVIFILGTFLMMIIIIYIGLLVSSIIQKLLGFGYSVYKEIVL